MADNKFNPAKFAGGFAIWRGKVFGKMLFLVIVISVALGIYHQLTKATFETNNKTVMQSPEEVYVDNRTMIEQNEKEMGFIGVKLWKLKLGLSYSAQSSAASSTGSVGQVESGGKEQK